jgi:hypothetical protein
LSKIDSTKKINTCFLAIVLIAGTFAALSPSFMIGADAQQYGMDQQKYNSYEPDYGMDSSYDNKQSYGKDSTSYDKSKDSSSTIEKKIKCNNINVNVNGFNGVEVGTLPTALTGLATETQEDEGEEGASSFGSGGSGSNDGGRPSGSDSDSRVGCINNNEFAIVEEESSVEDECAEDVEACFAENLSREDFDTLTAALEKGLDVVIEGEPVTLNSFADICSALGGLPFDQLQNAVNDIIQEALGFVPMNIEELYRCIANAVNIPVPDMR